MEKEISLKGFFLIVRCPSEEGLHITIDCSHLQPYAFIDLIHEIQDRIRDIDEAYSKKPERLRGRSLKALHKRLVWANERKRILRFAPFPSSMVNVLKTVRVQLYETIHRHAIVLQHEGGRNIYLLPEEEAEAFLKSIERLNRKLTDLEKKVEEFKDTNEFYDISYVLEKRRLPSLEGYSFHVGRIRVYLIPVSVDPHAIDEWAEKSPRVAEAVMEAQREFVEKALEEVKRKLKPIIERLLRRRRLKAMERELEKLERFARSLGLHALANTVIAPMISEVRMEVSSNRPKGEFEARIRSIAQQI